MASWQNEIAYHVLVDRFRAGRPQGGVRPGEFRFRDRAVEVSHDRRALVADRTHQHTFHNGDLAGIAASLPYLAELGVTVLLLSPIFESRSSHRYDPDSFALDPHLGDEAEFASLLERVHARGMKLVLDGVFGHTSFEHPWFQDPVLRAQRYMHHADGTPETWLGWGVMPKLDLDAAETQDALIAELGRWAGIDGWRLDAAQHLPATFLRRLRAELVASMPDAVVIAEEWEAVSSQLHEGLYDGVLNFQFRRPVVDWFRGEIASETLVRRLSVYMDGYPAAAVPHCWNLLDNHDTERFWGTHVREHRDLRLAVALQCLLPGTPMLYYGDEIGMRGANYRESRAPMVWEPRKADRGVSACYREFLGLRRGHAVFQRGTFAWVAASNSGKTVAFTRQDGDERVLVAVNRGERAHSIAFEGRTIKVAPGEVLIEWA